MADFIPFILAASVQFAAVVLAGHCILRRPPGPGRWLIPTLLVGIILVAQSIWFFAQPALDPADWLLLHAIFPWPLILPPIFSIVARFAHR